MAGCVPPLLVFFWFRGYLHKGDALYKTNCNRMLTAGFLTIFPVMLLSVCIVIPLNVSGLLESIVFVATSGPFDMLIRGIGMQLAMIAMRRWTERCQSPFFLWASARVRL